MRNILHVDCNCFYAAVEMQRKPQLRNIPLAVCGSQSERHGIVLTANYIAKKMGIKTGMAIWQAQQLCRDITIVPPDYKEYMRISGYVREIFEKYTDQIEPFGIDEAWLDVSGSTSIFGSADTIAKEISERAKFELGISVSIGVSNNKITAKLGSDYKKPDAITVINKANYKDIVYPLPVQDLLYVGRATQQKLNWIGIFTIGDLAMASPEMLQGRLGKMGLIISAFAKGEDITPVMKMGQGSVIKSVGNASTNPRDLISNSDVWIMLILLAESVAMRMRELCMKCTVAEVFVRDNALSSFTRQKKLESATCSSLEIAKTAYELFLKSYNWDKPIRSVGVRGSGLVQDTSVVQLSLFSNEAKHEKQEKIDTAMDNLRTKYGYESVRRAIIMSDSALGKINPKDDHNIHPVGFFKEA